MIKINNRQKPFYAILHNLIVATYYAFQLALLYSACHNALDYGVSQMRERVILVGVFKSFKQKFHFPKPTKMHFSISLYLILLLPFAKSDPINFIPNVKQGINRGFYAFREIGWEIHIFIAAHSFVFFNF